MSLVVDPTALRVIVSPAVSIARSVSAYFAKAPELPTDLGPSEGEGVNFNFKARPAANGIGLEEDAILTRATFQTIIRKARTGSGTLSLRGTVHDPVDELPIVSIAGASYVECDLIGSCRSVTTVPADVFLPYHHGRHDDWSALDTESAALVPVA